jgi:hypothetical protein
LSFFENKPGRRPSNPEIPNPTGDFSASRFDGSLFLIRHGMTLKTFAQGTLVDDAALRSGVHPHPAAGLASFAETGFLPSGDSKSRVTFLVLHNGNSDDRVIERAE